MLGTYCWDVLKGVIRVPLQEVFKDMFASPRHSSACVTPTKDKDRDSEGEGSAWEKATEWSKNILDISRPFAFSGDNEGSTHASPRDILHQPELANAVNAEFNQVRTSDGSPASADAHQVGQFDLK